MPCKMSKHMMKSKMAKMSKSKKHKAKHKTR